MNISETLLLSISFLLSLTNCKSRYNKTPGFTDSKSIEILLVGQKSLVYDPHNDQLKPLNNPGTNYFEHVGTQHVAASKFHQQLKDPRSQMAIVVMGHPDLELSQRVMVFESRGFLKPFPELPIRNRNLVAASYSRYRKIIACFEAIGGFATKHQCYQLGYDKTWKLMRSFIQFAPPQKLYGFYDFYGKNSIFDTFAYTSRRTNSELTIARDPFFGNNFEKKNTSDYTRVKMSDKLMNATVAISGTDILACGGYIRTNEGDSGRSYSITQPTNKCELVDISNTKEYFLYFPFGNGMQKARFHPKIVIHSNYPELAHIFGGINDEGKVVHEIEAFSSTKQSFILKNSGLPEDMPPFEVFTFPSGTFQ